VLLVLGVMTLWQLALLLQRQSTMSAFVVGQSRPLLEVSVPLTPGLDTFKAVAREIGATSESAAALTQLAQDMKQDRGMIFQATGPLDDLLKPGAFAAPEAPAAITAPIVPVVDDKNCLNVHPNADSPDMLHVVWASDISQVEGVMASVASVVASTTAPLTVHILVQEKWVKDFKERFGVHPECQGTVTVGGVLIRIYAIDGKQIQRAVAKVSQSVLKQRGSIDTPENFARFYMHLLLEKTIVIYLDADTIVQADLAQLQKQLKASGKTIGFVNRHGNVKIDMFVRNKKALKMCGLHAPDYRKLLGMTAYNVGVYAVDLQRWSDKQMARRVEELVAQHNACGGEMWIGGSQPPLLLAFFVRPVGEPEDFIVFDKAWNAGDLGWRDNLKEKTLRTNYVLHWNGNMKPWNDNGLYVSLWRPHRDSFSTLMRPYDAGRENLAAAGKDDAKEKKKRKSTTSMSPSMIAAQAKCPGVALLDDWTPEKDGRCEIGTSYGCSDAGGGIWAKGGCVGLFNVDGKVTTCGGQYTGQCSPGSLPQPAAKCGIMILTSYFTTRTDWQRKKKARVGFEKIEKLYRGIVQLGLNVTMIYDDLPEELIKTYTCDRFHFEQVNLNDFDRRYGVNDVRYYFFERLVRANAEWKTIFIIDAFDVHVAMNPCHGVKDGMLYIGTELDNLRKHPWMAARFKKMGGKYLLWFMKVQPKVKILNCGLTGGRREMMLQLLKRMCEVLKDPAIKIMQKKDEEINLNMAALNYIIYNEFAGKFAGNAPMHSKYKRYERSRTDVWFIHK